MFALGGIIPLINVSYLQNGFETYSYGRVRLYGTLGFTLPNAWIMFYKIPSFQAVKYAGWIILLSAVFLFFLPEGRKITQVAEEAISLKRAWKLLKSKLFITFLFVLFLFSFSFSATEYVLSSYIQTISFPLDPVPFTWFLGTMVEIAFFFISPWLISKYGSLILVFIGLTAGFLRFSILALPINPEIMLYIQGLHGIQFSGAYLGSLYYLKEKAHPQRLAMAQALYTTFARAIGTGIGGYILGNIGGTGDFKKVFFYAAIASAMSMIGLLIYLPFQKKHIHFVD
jgi:PPP family 3-phenylpropionic acid transporter